MIIKYVGRVIGLVINPDFLSCLANQMSLPPSPRFDYLRDFVIDLLADSFVVHYFVIALVVVTM